MDILKEPRDSPKFVNEPISDGSGPAKVLFQRDSSSVGHGHEKT